MKILQISKVVQTMILISVFDFILCFNTAQAQKAKQIVDLTGNWKFSIGDNMEWASPGYNDNNWENIQVPSSWENQGYYGYNGYAWYRKSFYLSQAYKDKSLMLDLGYIDDVDEVYLNGVLIGYSGSFPPYFSSAFSARRKYYIPSELIRISDHNTIAIRIFDAKREGGIIYGEVALLELVNPVPLDINLKGIWKFRTGDNPAWKNPKSDDPGWFPILVPGNWENLGYNDYDGFAWYYKTFKANKNLASKSLLLIMGKIDDLDEVYLNDILVGSTGKLNSDPRKIRSSDEWSRFRVYEIPDNILKYTATNTITVRVYDVKRGGGIYQGPIGIITKDKYAQYLDNKR